MQSTENVEKWKFWFVEVLIRSQVFHNIRNFIYIFNIF